MFYSQVHVLPQLSDRNAIKHSQVKFRHLQATAHLKILECSGTKRLQYIVVINVEVTASVANVAKTSIEVRQHVVVQDVAGGVKK